MPLNPLQALETVTLSTIINRIQPPPSLLRQTLVQREQTLATETVELGTKDRDRLQTAPFSPPGMTAQIVGGRTRNIRHFTAPNMRIKSSINPGDFMYSRELGNTFYVDANGSGQMDFSALLTQRVTEHLVDLNDRMTATEEWMISQAMLGLISYSSPGDDVFVIDYARPSGHTITLTGTSLWNDPAAYPIQQFNDAARMVADAEGTRITDCIMSRSAADAFLRNPAILSLLDNRRVEIGTIELVSSFNADGTVRYLGTIGTVRCWEYSRSLRVAGAVNPLIRDKYVEFISTSGNDIEMHYASIPDLDAISPRGDIAQVLGGNVRAKRFSKSWGVQDPSSRWVMAQSRPFPVVARPGTSVSFKVLP